MDLFDLITESQKEARKGVVSGLASRGSSAPNSVSSKKSRVKVYKSIKDALKKGHYGQIFSTKAANRLYVITKRKWGKDDEQAVGDKVAKGFSSGSIPSSFSDIKGYAVRTLVKHGKQHSKKFEKSPRYWKSKRNSR